MPGQVDGISNGRITMRANPPKTCIAPFKILHGPLVQWRHRKEPAVWADGRTCVTAAPVRPALAGPRHQEATNDHTQMSYLKSVLSAGSASSRRCAQRERSQTTLFSGVGATCRAEHACDPSAARTGASKSKLLGVIVALMSKDLLCEEHGQRNAVRTTASARSI
jgi:hypothetical protein